MFNSTLTLSEIALKRGDRLLISGLNLGLRAGDAVELRGFNGAGKSTLLRAICGLHTPLAGKIVIDNSPEIQVLENVAFLGHLDAIKSNQTIKGQLEFWCNLFGAKNTQITNIVELLDIAHLLPLMGASLSAGQKRRVSIARIMLSGRPIWLLDEPFAPLDTKGRKQLGQIIDAHRDNGGIVIAAVHDKPECRPMQLLNLEEYAANIDFYGDDYD